MSEEKPSTSTLKSKLRLAILILVGLFFIVFAIANAVTVEVNLLFAQVSMPRFLLLIGVFGLGGVTGWLLRPRRAK